MGVKGMIALACPFVQLSREMACGPNSSDSRASSRSQAVD